MKAGFYQGSGVMRVGESEPVAPGRGEVQLRVAYCGICGTDLHIFQGHMDRRVRAPQVLGHEMSGTIEALGEGVEGWGVGDRVTVRPLAPCGRCPACRLGHDHICANLKFLGIDTPGAMQGRWTVPAHTLHRLPDDLPLEHGALIEPIAVAVHDVRRGEVEPGEFVVVQGGGPIGLLMALVAKQRGARVLVTEVNPFRLDLARRLGLDTANPAQTDVVQHVHDHTGGAGADVVFEVSGSAAGAGLMTRLPRARGRIVVVAIFADPPPVNLFDMFWREIQLRGARVYEPMDFDRAIELAASGGLPLERIISKVRPLEEIGAGFEELRRGGEVVKVLMRCSS